MLERLHGRQSTRAVGGEAATHEIDGLVELRLIILGGRLGDLLVPQFRVESANNFVNVGVNGRLGLRHVRDEGAVCARERVRDQLRTVQNCAFLQSMRAEESTKLHECLDIVVRVEEWEATSEEAEQHDAGGPDIERCRRQLWTRPCDAPTV